MPRLRTPEYSGPTDERGMEHALAILSNCIGRPLRMDQLYIDHQNGYVRPRWKRSGRLGARRFRLAVARSKPIFPVRPLDLLWLPGSKPTLKP